MNRADRRAAWRAVLERARRDLDRDLDRMEERVFVGLPAARTFACQSCGRARAVHEGDSILCCGKASAAEVLPPGTGP